MAAAPTKCKVVVRKLPPALTEDGFRSAVDKILADMPHDFITYCPGKASAKRVVCSRAYINFISPESVLAFKAGFDGHVFVGSRGNQYRCSVEYAPYQKIPKKSSKKDRRDGTITSDPDYIEFVKLLEEGPSALPSASAQLEAQERAAAGGGVTDSTPVVTSLMQYLQERYAARPGLKLGGLKKLKREEAKKQAAESEKVLKKKERHDKDGKGKDRGVAKDAAAAKPGRAASSKPSGKHSAAQQPRSGIRSTVDAAAAAASAPALDHAQGRPQDSGVSAPKVLLKKQRHAAASGTAAGAPHAAAAPNAGDGHGKGKGPASKSGGKQPAGLDTGGKQQGQTHTQQPHQQQPDPQHGKKGRKQDAGASERSAKAPPAAGKGARQGKGPPQHPQAERQSKPQAHSRGAPEAVAASGQQQAAAASGGSGGSARGTSHAPPPATQVPARAAPSPSTASTASAATAAAGSEPSEGKKKVRRGFQAYVPGASQLSAARRDAASRSGGGG